VPRLPQTKSYALVRGKVACPVDAKHLYGAVQKVGGSIPPKDTRSVFLGGIEQKWGREKLVFPVKESIENRGFSKSEASEISSQGHTFNLRFWCGGEIPARPSEAFSLRHSISEGEGEGGPSAQLKVWMGFFCF